MAYTKEQKEKAIQLYVDGYSLQKVSDMIGISISGISSYVKNAGLVVRNPGSYPKSYKQKYCKSRKHALNINYFNEIDTPQKAYILGFLYADGCVNSDRGVLKIGIHKQDVEIIHFIKNELQSTAEIKQCNRKENLIYINFNSRVLVDDLVKWGCMQKKTFKLTFPEFLSDELMSHFIRGYFDGDGCIYNYKKGGRALINFVGNLDFIEGMNNFLSKSLDIKKSPLTFHRNAVYIRFHAKQKIIMLYEYMYNNSSFNLSRKLNKFQYFFQVNKTQSELSKLNI